MGEAGGVLCELAVDDDGLELLAHLLTRGANVDIGALLVGSLEHERVAEVGGERRPVEHGRVFATKGRHFESLEYLLLVVVAVETRLLGRGRRLKDVFLV